ncbi:lithostathine-like isoform X1 [Mesoplodon densirostris]|uniref:lithostathine-like isoform X1 n=1 Tax=Mesoplodon densirostris TaxID=48708 RepID=UPI0028DC1B48|nr:lithostathine-like isoform X1 [Mesoplodon densirostris]
MMPSMGLSSLSWMLLSCLMLLSQVQGEDSQEKLSSARLSCPRGSMAYASNCYALFITPKTWMGANMACQKRPSGHLVSVLSGSEGSFVASLVKNSLNTPSAVWIGLHDSSEGSEGEWEWSNSDVLSYVAWENDAPARPSPGYCGSLSRSSGYMKWRDYKCCVKLPYVCKFKD